MAEETKKQSKYNASSQAADQDFDKSSCFSLI